MKRRGGARGRRRASRHDERRGTRRVSVVTAALSLALLAAVVAAALAGAGCGGSARTADLTPFVGGWERVEAGAPNPDFTLDIERSGDGVQVIFANQTNRMSQTVSGESRGGGIACTVPNRGGGASPGSPAPGVPTESDLMLSLDENGQLIVDLVLADGTLEPIWIYQRADGASPSAPGTR